jgi:hypothetical protein
MHYYVVPIKYEFGGGLFEGTMYSEDGIISNQLHPSIDAIDRFSAVPINAISTGSIIIIIACVDTIIPTPIPS